MPGVNVLVSIHAAQAGCDLLLHLCQELTYLFQFTQPKRAATAREPPPKYSGRCFNSRSPSGLRPFIGRGFERRITFQFTQPKRAATMPMLINLPTFGFQFTQPKRAATWLSRWLSGILAVSIHAAQAGCDIQWHGVTRDTWSFNSRSPSGLRRLLQRYNKKEFLSKDKSRKSLLVIIIDVEDKAIELELTDNQPLRNSNKIMFTWGSQPKTFV